MTLDDWSAFFYWATLISVGVSAIAGAGAAIVGKFSGDRQETKLAEAQTRAEEARARAEEAHKEAAVATAGAANANERAAKLEIDAGAQRERAATAERKLLEIQARISDRHLAPEQARTISTQLTGVRPSGHLAVSCVGGPPEPCSYAMQIVEALRGAEWAVDQPDAVLFAGAGPVGIWLKAKSEHGPVWGVELQAALRAAGIESSFEATPDMGESDVQLLVGHKQ